MGGKAAEVFQEVNYIPLESSKASLFNTIDQLFISEDFYIILDRIGNAILLFNKDGSFHHKIDRIPERGKSSLPGALFDAVSVDYKRKEIISKSSYGNESDYLYFFDFNGTFLRKFKMGVNASEFTSIGAGNQILYDSPPSEKNDLSTEIFHSLAYINKKGEVIKRLFPYDIYLPSDDRWSHDLNLYSSGNGDRALYKNFYNYTVIELDSAGIVRDYTFLFPLSYSLPEDFLTSVVYDNNREEFIKKNSSLIYSLSNLYKVDDYFLFHTESMDPQERKKDFIYNLKTGTLLSYQHILPDSSNSYLPLYNFMSNIQAVNGDSFYTFIPSSQMFADFDGNKRRKPVYGKKLTEFFTTRSRIDNPVIVQLKLKKGL